MTSKVQHRRYRNLIPRIRLRAATAALASAIVLAACVIAAPSVQAQTFTSLYSFDYTDGQNPNALVQATDGNLYGTALGGGANGNDGTVFRINPSGAQTTLYNFCSQSGCADGSTPGLIGGALIQAPNGNFYGITGYGGATGSGTIFSITPSGALATLYNFCSQSGCTDGGGPNASLVLATDGNFYGTAYFGGANGSGTVFKISPAGILTTLYSFCSQSGCTDGENPQVGLVQGTDGNFYGTMVNGGANGAGCVYGSCGTVFKITSSGTLTTLYSFCSQSGCTDGENPFSALVQGTDGNFYGTTTYGGADGGGTVFKITPTGTLTTLYNFCSQSGCTDGASPIYAALIEGTDRNFYGTTTSGGANVNGGTIFRITPGGALTTLYNFCSQSGCEDGSASEAALVQDTNGKFYGTTDMGGAGGADCFNPNGCGSAFSLAVGLRPFVETQTTSGKVGSLVKILGTNLTGTTGVSFNGTAAKFTVNSAGTAIKTAVPSGATTGFVTVTTPSRTLKSNVKFRVRP